MGELSFECRVVGKYSKAKMIEKIGDTDNPGNFISMK